MNDQAAAAVRQVWQSLVDGGIPCLPLSLGAQPHISLCVYESLDGKCVTQQLALFAQQCASFPFVLERVRTFAGSGGVVFLAPRPSGELTELHNLFHATFAAYQVTASAYYLPTNWVPHCTVAEGLTAHQVRQAVAICEKSPLPIQGNFVDICLVEFRPVKQICAFEMRNR